MMAKHRNGTNVLPGYEAQAHIKKTAEAFGESGDAVLESLRKDNPASRMVFHLMGLKKSDVFPRGRPQDAARLDFIQYVMDDLAYQIDPETGEEKGLDSAFKRAPRYLADPKLRAKEGIVRGDLKIEGRGDRKLLSEAAVRKAYERARDNIPQRYWEEIET